MFWGLLLTLFISIILYIFRDHNTETLVISFCIFILLGTIISCFNSDIMTIKTDEVSSNTYQVIEYKEYKEINDETDMVILYSTKDNNSYKITPDNDTTVISNTINPTTVTVEENQYFNLWFLISSTKYTYTFS